MSSNKDGIFQKCYKKLCEYICLKDLEEHCVEEFAQLDNNYSRVGYLLRLQQGITTSQILESPAKTTKDLQKALSLKNEGNKHFQKKNHEHALLVYNRALVLTPLTNNDGLLAVCFANRSAVLFSLSKYQECLADIQLAIQHGYPENMQYKLLARKAKCHQFLTLRSDFDLSVEVAMSSLLISNLDESGRQTWNKELSKLSYKPQKAKSKATDEAFESRNVSFPALCSMAGIAENSEFGRFVHAEESIRAGSNVLIEEPFCSVTLPEYYLSHCCHCQRRADITSYPCRDCADVVYCHAECEQAAWQQYHEYECDNILNLRDVNVNMGHLAMRTATKVGYKELKAIADGSSTEVDTGVPYDSLDYRNVFNLGGHERERSGKDLFWRAYAALILAQIYNGNKWGEGEDDSTLVLAAFILHHMQIMPCNAHEISELLYIEDQPHQSELLEVGAGIYPTLSLFNHSCDPTVVRTFLHGNTCVMKALSPIAKYEQIYDNYGMLYAVHAVKERQLKLQGQYYFQCCCSPCLQNWSPYEELDYNAEPMYKCIRCQSLMAPPDEKQCGNCQAPFDKAVVDGQLQRAKAMFEKDLGDLFLGSLGETTLSEKVKKFAVYSQLVNNLVYRPYKTLNDCQEALKHLYSLMGNSVLRKKNTTK